MNPSRRDLRQRLACRQREEAELERQLEAVRRWYADEGAPLEEKVLRLRMGHLRRAAQRHMRSAKHRNAYHDAQREYEARTARELRRAVTTLESAIESIRATDAYQAIAEEADVEAVLRTRAEALRRMLDELKAVY